MADDYSFLKDYSLDFLISNKDKKSDFYQILHNTCAYLLEDHNPSESEIRVAWNIFKTFFLVGIYLEEQLAEKIFNSFADNFNHSEESSVEFFLRVFSDMINETLITDWNTPPQAPIEFPLLSKEKKKVPSKKRDKSIDIFFSEYVNQGGERIPQPKQEEMQSFAKATLLIIEEKKVKEALKKITFGSFTDWLPKEIKKTLDGIGKLTLRDGEILMAAKPLVEKLRENYSASQSLIIDTNAGIEEPPKPPEPKERGGKINIWLDWYHSMLDSGRKCTLEDVAKKSGYSIGYIKQKHMVYKAGPNQTT